ncbi:MAG: hypothetical protein ACJ74H_01805 [Thermoanaerobaculia bacterium]
MSAIDVFVFFVGLTTFTPGAPNDCGLKAILPRVVYSGLQIRDDYHVHNMSAAPQLREAATPPHRQLDSRGPYGARAYRVEEPHVEDHIAVLIFETSAYVSNVNWPIKNLPAVVGKPQYSYAPLDRDRVRFLTSGATNPQATLANMPLPHLPQICSATTKLRRDYLPPYAGAAAVFDIPEGSLQACLSTAQHAPYGQRIDTKIQLKTSGDFVISASTMKQAKELRLKAASNGQLNVAVANVPVGFVNGNYAPKPANAIDGVPHVHAYYAMGDADASSCTQTLTDWYNNTHPNVPPCSIPSSFEGLGKMAATRNQRSDINLAVLPPVLGEKSVIYNFECSNTQWP